MTKRSLGWSRVNGQQTTRKSTARSEALVNFNRDKSLRRME
jgi:hypothetical protein